MTKSKTKPMVRIHDVSTNEVIDREMTDLEFAQYEADQTELANRLAEIKTKEAERNFRLNQLIHGLEWVL